MGPSSTTPVDAKEAALRVRQMFEDVHGAYGVIGFELGNVKEGKDGNWLVECSFWPGLGTREKVEYRVTVGKDGRIVSQEKVGKAQ